MKIDWNSKYTTIAVYTVLSICSIIIFYLSISHIDIVFNELNGAVVIMEPFIMGFSIAYILNFILKFFENTIFEYKSIKNFGIAKRSKRGLSIVLTYISAALLIYLFIKFLLPQLIDSIVGLINDVPMYINKTTKFIDDTLMQLNIQEEYLKLINDNFNEFINYIIKFATNLIPVLGSMITSVASSIWNIVLGIIISIYLLIDKERFCALSKKIIYALFSNNVAEKIIEITHRSNATFGKFLMGKILDSIIIGILTFFILTIFKMPYTILISVIIGITNIIPFFGPFIGAIPSIIITVFISPIKALWLVLIIFIIQQIDGNIIGPKILGNSIGISAFWILFAILVAGKFLGLVGMIIGVPLFAVIYSLIKEVIEARLRKKGMKVKTEEYLLK